MAEEKKKEKRQQAKLSSQQQREQLALLTALCPPYTPLVLCKQCGDQLQAEAREPSLREAWRWSWISDASEMLVMENPGRCEQMWALVTYDIDTSTEKKKKTEQDLKMSCMK